MLKSLILAVAGCAVLGIASCDAPSDSTVVENCSSFPITQNPQDNVALDQCLIRAAQEGLNDPGEDSVEHQDDKSTLAKEQASLAIDERKASLAISEPAPAPAAEPAVAQTINVNGFTATPPEPPSGGDPRDTKVRDCVYKYLPRLNKEIQNDYVSNAQLDPEDQDTAEAIADDFNNIAITINYCIGGNAYIFHRGDTSVEDDYDPNWVPADMGDTTGPMDRDVNGNLIE